MTGTDGALIIIGGWVLAAAVIVGIGALLRWRDRRAGKKT
jgi:hypothetical protein